MLAIFELVLCTFFHNVLRKRAVMDYKQAIIENAWGGISMDYGLLHVQLATPVAAFILMIIVMIALNKLLFQPVLRTMDKRKSVIGENQDKTEAARKRIETLSQEYQEKFDEARQQASVARQEARQQATKYRESLLKSTRAEAEAELEKQRENLTNEIKVARTALEKETTNIATLVTNQLLN